MEKKCPVEDERRQRAVDLDQDDEIFSFNRSVISGTTKFWTGFEASTIKDHFIAPMAKAHGSRNKGGVKLEDRVFWALAVLNSDLSASAIWRLRGGGLKPEKIGSKSATNNLLQRTVKQLVKVKKGIVRFPKDFMEWKAWCQNEVYKDCESCSGKLMMIIDGTPIRTFEPTEFQLRRKAWKNYKKTCCYGMFVLCAPNGRITFASPLFWGEITDKTSYDMCGVREMLEEHFRGWDFDGLKPFIGGDKGYPTIKPPEGWGLMITASGKNEFLERVEKEKEKQQKKSNNKRKRGKNGKETEKDGGSTQTSAFLGQSPIEDLDLDQLQDLLSDDSMIFASDFAPSRGVVEQSICQLKRFRKLKEGRIRMTDSYEFINNLVQLAAICVNTKMEANCVMKW